MKLFASKRPSEVKAGNEIRKDHKFGRYLTYWRKQHTDDDKSPLETKS